MFPTQLVALIRSYFNFKGIMVFNVTFNNMSVLLVEGTGENHRSICRKSLTNSITSSCIEYTSPPCTGFEMTTLVVVGTDFTGSSKSNYHTTTTAVQI